MIIAIDAVEVATQLTIEHMMRIYVLNKIEVDNIIDNSEEHAAAYRQIYDHYFDLLINSDQNAF